MADGPLRAMNILCLHVQNLLQARWSELMLLISKTQTTYHLLRIWCRYTYSWGPGVYRRSGPWSVVMEV